MMLSVRHGQRAGINAAAAGTTTTQHLLAVLHFTRQTLGDLVVVFDHTARARAADGGGGSRCRIGISMAAWRSLLLLLMGMVW
jgi:hypothetical protein